MSTSLPTMLLKKQSTNSQPAVAQFTSAWLGLGSSAMRHATTCLGAGRSEVFAIVLLLSIWCCQFFTLLDGTHQVEKFDHQPLQTAVNCIGEDSLTAIIFQANETALGPASRTTSMLNNIFRFMEALPLHVFWMSFAPGWAGVLGVGALLSAMCYAEARRAKWYSDRVRTICVAALHLGPFVGGAVSVARDVRAVCFSNKVSTAVHMVWHYALFMVLPLQARVHMAVMVAKLAANTMLVAAHGYECCTTMHYQPVCHRPTPIDIMLGVCSHLPMVTVVTCWLHRRQTRSKETVSREPPHATPQPSSAQAAQAPMTAEQPRKPRAAMSEPMSPGSVLFADVLSTVDSRRSSAATVSGFPTSFQPDQPTVPISQDATSTTPGTTPATITPGGAPKPSPMNYFVAPKKSTPSVPAIQATATTAGRSFNAAREASVTDISAAKEGTFKPLKINVSQYLAAAKQEMEAKAANKRSNVGVLYQSKTRGRVVSVKVETPPDADFGAAARTLTSAGAAALRSALPSAKLVHLQSVAVKGCVQLLFWVQDPTDTNEVMPWRGAAELRKGLLEVMPELEDGDMHIYSRGEGAEGMDGVQGLSVPPVEIASLTPIVTEPGKPTMLEIAVQGNLSKLKLKGAPQMDGTATPADPTGGILRLVVVAGDRVIDDVQFWEVPEDGLLRCVLREQPTACMTRVYIIYQGAHMPGATLAAEPLPVLLPPAAAEVRKLADSIIDILAQSNADDDGHHDSYARKPIDKSDRCVSPRDIASASEIPTADWNAGEHKETMQATPQGALTTVSDAMDLAVIAWREHLRPLMHDLMFVTDVDLSEASNDQLKQYTQMLEGVMDYLASQGCNALLAQVTQWLVDAGVLEAPPPPATGAAPAGMWPVIEQPEISEASEDEGPLSGLFQMLDTSGSYAVEEPGNGFGGGAREAKEAAARIEDELDSETPAEPTHALAFDTFHGFYDLLMEQQYLRYKHRAFITLDFLAAAFWTTYWFAAVRRLSELGDHPTLFFMTFFLLFKELPYAVLLGSRIIFTRHRETLILASELCRILFMVCAFLAWSPLPTGLLTVLRGYHVDVLILGIIRPCCQQIRFPLHLVVAILDAVNSTIMVCKVASKAHCLIVLGRMASIAAISAYVDWLIDLSTRKQFARLMTVAAGKSGVPVASISDKLAETK